MCAHRPNALFDFTFSTAALTPFIVRKSLAKGLSSHVQTLKLWFSFQLSWHGWKKVFFFEGDDMQQHLTEYIRGVQVCAESLCQPRDGECLDYKVKKSRTFLKLKLKWQINLNVCLKAWLTDHAIVAMFVFVFCWLTSGQIPPPQSLYP